jgi:DNA polymerase-3 subunit beta
MKLTVNRAAFLKAAQACESVVPKSDVKPVLKHAKLVADGERCTLAATDLEVGVRLVVAGVSVGEPGEAMLPAALLAQMLGAAGDEEVTIEADADRFRVVGSATEFEHPAEDVAAWPAFPGVPEGDCYELPAAALALAVRRTNGFSGPDSRNRFLAMTGVAWEAGGDFLTAVATDGNGLAVVTLPAEKRGEPAGDVSVVPARAMRLLTKVCTAGPVRVAFAPNEAHFAGDGGEIYCRLLEGRFPAWKNVIPKGAGTTATVTAGALLAAVRSAAVMANDDALTKRVVLAFSKSRVVVTAARDTGGKSKAEAPLDLDGKGVTIVFAPALLLEFLRVLDANQELRIELKDGKTPAVFRAGSDYLYVAVPLTNGD